MTAHEEPGLTVHGRTFARRQVLAGLVGVGGLGALTGAGTAALLSDRDGFTGLLESGGLDLTVAWTAPTGGGSSNGPFVLDLDLTPADSSGHAVIELTLADTGPDQNPGYLWLRTECPTPVSELSEELDVELWYADGDGDRSGSDPILSGSLGEFAEAGLAGLALDAAGDVDATETGRACLDPGQTRHLRFEWSLAGYTGADTATTANITFAAVQCRHTTGTENPFPTPSVLECGRYTTPTPSTPRYAVSHISVYAYDGEACVFLGKLDDVEGDLDVGESYDIGDMDGADTGYDLVVLDTVENDEGEVTEVAFEVVDPTGDDPELCRVLIKGARGTETYDESYLTGNATDGLLGAPEKNDGGRGGGRS